MIIVKELTDKALFEKQTISSAIAEIACVGGYYTVQSHSRSVILVPKKTSVPLSTSE